MQLLSAHQFQNGRCVFSNPIRLFGTNTRFLASPRAKISIVNLASAAGATEEKFERISAKKWYFCEEIRRIINNLSRRACTHEWKVGAPAQLNCTNKPSRAPDARAKKTWDILKSTLKSCSLVTFETRCSTKSTTKVDSVILDNGQFVFSKARWCSNAH